MKTTLKKVSAAALTLAVMASAAVFDVPGSLTVNGASAAGGCNGAHSGTVWDGSELAAGGSYYLDDSVVLSAEINITGDVTLCLNGQTITAASGSRV